MVDSLSPQVQVEPAGSQVAGFAMGRFAVLAAEVEDDGVVVGEGARPPGPTQWYTDAEFSIGRPSEFFSRSHAESYRERFERVHVEGLNRPSQATNVPESVCDALEFDLTQADSDDPVRIRNRFGSVEVSDEETASMAGDERGSEVGERDSVPSDHDEGSEVSVDEEREPPTAPDPEVISTRGLSPAIRAAMAELDGIDLSMEFSKRAVVMKSVPHFL